MPHMKPSGAPGVRQASTTAAYARSASPRATAPCPQQLEQSLSAGRITQSSSWPHARAASRGENVKRESRPPSGPPPPPSGSDDPVHAWSAPITTIPGTNHVFDGILDIDSHRTSVGASPSGRSSGASAWWAGKDAARLRRAHDAAARLALRRRGDSRSRTAHAPGRGREHAPWRSLSSLRRDAPLRPFRPRHRCTRERRRSRGGSS